MRKVLAALALLGALLTSAKADTVTLPAVADSYVSYGAQSTNYGTATVVNVESNGATDPLTRWGYWKFDLSSLDGATITSATLRLYGRSTNATSDTVRTYLTTPSWTETGLIWTNKPGISATTYADSVIGTTAQYYTWDVTTMCPSFVLPSTLVAFLQKTTALNPTHLPDVFNSKESTSNTPQLTVTYSYPAPGAVAAMPDVTDNQVQLWWQSTTNAGGYNVYRTLAGQVAWTMIASALTTTKYVDTTAAAGTAYNYAVTSYYGPNQVESQHTVAKLMNFAQNPGFKRVGSQITWNSISGATEYALLYNPYGSIGTVFAADTAGTSAPFLRSVSYELGVLGTNAITTGTPPPSGDFRQQSFTWTELSAAINPATGQPLRVGSDDCIFNWYTDKAYTVTLPFCNALSMMNGGSVFSVPGQLVAEDIVGTYSYQWQWAGGGPKPHEVWIEVSADAYAIDQSPDPAPFVMDLSSDDGIGRPSSSVVRTATSGGWTYMANSSDITFALVDVDQSSGLATFTTTLGVSGEGESQQYTMAAQAGAGCNALPVTVGHWAKASDATGTTQITFYNPTTTFANDNYSNNQAQALMYPLLGSSQSATFSGTPVGTYVWVDDGVSLWAGQDPLPGPYQIKNTSTVTCATGGMSAVFSYWDLDTGLGDSEAGSDPFGASLTWHRTDEVAPKDGGFNYQLHNNPFFPQIDATLTPDCGCAGEPAVPATLTLSSTVDLLTPYD